MRNTILKLDDVFTEDIVKKILDNFGFRQVESFYREVIHFSGDDMSRINVHNAKRYEYLVSKGEIQICIQEGNLTYREDNITNFINKIMESRKNKHEESCYNCKHMSISCENDLYKCTHESHEFKIGTREDCIVHSCKDFESILKEDILKRKCGFKRI